MKKFGFLITLLLFLAACGSAPKHISTSKNSQKVNHAKKGQQKYVPLYGDDNTLDDNYYDTLGHRHGSGVGYSKYIEQNGKFDIPVVQNDAVQKWIDYFTGRGREHFARYLARSGRFVPYMHSVLAQYNLPKDLVYLSMIESGFNTRAMSFAAAGGLWQFIRSTGAIYGLQGDYYVDERADPEKATNAAARHLKDLYDEFGDWYLAFAAYNAGAGKVRNAIQRDGNNFWDMAAGSYLRQETKDYVPKIIAAAIIAKNPRKYGFTDVDYQQPIAFERVTMKSPTDLEVAAECAGVDPDLIRLLNPELMRDMTPPNISAYQLRIPRGTRDRFMRKYVAMSPADRMRTTFYTVRSGDSLREIADNYGVSERDLVAANSDKVDVDRDRHSRTEKVAVRKGKRTQYVSKKVNYTTVSYDVDPGQVLVIPKSRGMAKNASSRDDAAAHAARREFGINVAAADDEVVKGKNKNKKDKKKEKQEKQIAEAKKLQPMETPDREPVAAQPAPTVARGDGKSDLDDSVYQGDRGGSSPRDSRLVATSTTGDAPAPGDSPNAGTPMAMNDRPAEASANAGTPVSPSDAEMKAAVNSLKSDEPAVEGAAPAAAPSKEWVPEQEKPAAAEAPAVQPKAAAPVKKTVYHQVKPGDTLTSIASKYGVSVADLKKWNGNKVVPYPKKGTTLTVSAKSSAVATKEATKPAKTTTAKATAKPTTSKVAATSKTAKKPTTTASATATAKKNSVVKYKVKPGDSLMTIAKRHDTTPAAIQKLNGMKSSKLIPGAVLVVQSK